MNWFLIVYLGVSAVCGRYAIESDPMTFDQCAAAVKAAKSDIPNGAENESMFVAFCSNKRRYADD